MEGIVLLVRRVLSFAKQDDDRADSAEQRVTRSFVGFPRGNELAESVVECGFVDFDLFRHFLLVLKEAEASVVL